AAANGTSDRGGHGLVRRTGDRARYALSAGVRVANQARDCDRVARTAPAGSNLLDVNQKRAVSRYINRERVSRRGASTRITKIIRAQVSWNKGAQVSHGDDLVRVVNTSCRCRDRHADSNRRSVGERVQIISVLSSVAS